MRSRKPPAHSAILLVLGSSLGSGRGRGVILAHLTFSDLSPIPKQRNKTVKLIIDKAGRVTLPKRLREQLHLAPGATLDLESEGEKITMRPIRAKAILAKEYSVWVYQGGLGDDSIPELIDREREERLREFFWTPLTPPAQAPVAPASPLAAARPSSTRESHPSFANNPRSPIRHDP